jgi:aspartate/methionine/tyrosine aminotransferase
MKFQRIKYLEWVQENLPAIEHDLATASITPCELEDLDIDPSGIEINGPNFADYQPLLEHLEQIYDLSREQIVLTQGASMGIFLALNAVLEEGSEVVLEVPNYEPFYRISKAIGARVRILERSFEDHFQLSLEQLERKISSRTDLVVMTNLHNPSGVATHPEKLQTIGQIARENDAQLICGEAYLESVFEHSLPPICSIAENGISIGSLSKAYGLDGLRIGWIFCNPSLKERIKSIRNYLSPRNTYPAQQIAAATLEKRNVLLEKGKELVRRNKQILQEWVEKREDVQWVPPDGGPICFFKITSNVDVWDLTTTLKQEYGTLVVPGDFFWAKGFIRIGFGQETQRLRTGIEHLGSALDELTPRRNFYS